MSDIRSYDDLLKEKSRLEATLQLQKELIRRDVAMLREDIKPVQHALSTVSRMTSSKMDNPLIRAGLGLAGDVLLGSTLITGGGWLTRLIAPVVVRNLSNIFIKKKPEPAFGWIGKLLHRSNGRPH